MANALSVNCNCRQPRDRVLPMRVDLNEENEVDKTRAKHTTESFNKDRMRDSEVHRGWSLSEMVEVIEQG